jgi:hypothetical protein
MNCCLKEKKIQMEMKDDEKVISFLESFLSLRNQLIGVEETFSNEKLIFQLLCASSKSFRGFVSLMGNQPNLAFDQLCHALRKEEVFLGVTFQIQLWCFMKTIKRNYKKIIQNTIGEGNQSDNYLI